MEWLYLDDERLPSKEFLSSSRINSVEDTIHVFKNGESLITWLYDFLSCSNKEYSLSFDNDLGIGILEGRHTLDKILEMCTENEFKLPMYIRIHTNNPIAKDAMQKAVQSYVRIFNLNICETMRLWKIAYMEKSSTEKEFEDFKKEFNFILH